MKIKFLARDKSPRFYSISGSVINGIDTALFPEGATFIGATETDDAGVYGMEWVGGILHVTLGQMTKMVEFPIAAREGDWIDAADYDPAHCYVKAASPLAVELLDSGQAEYFQDTDGKWSVRTIEGVAV
jgi:hypothetical protein